MADLFDRYGISAGAGASAGAAAPAKGDLFDRYSPGAGGVQDFEPMPAESGGVVDAVNRGVNWLGTRATKAGTALLGAPRAFSDLNRMAQEATGLRFAPVDPVSIAGQFLPSSEDLNNLVFDRFGVPQVNLPGPVGKVVDAGTEAALGAIVMPGSLVRNVVPAITGGMTQEVAGQVTEGTPYEPVARLVAGVAGGAGAAAIQNALGNVGQAAKNIRPNVDKTAAKIVGRSMERDRVTGNALAQAQADLGPGAMLVEAGGPNIRGTMRGSIAAPGAARTATQNAFEGRLEGSDIRTTGALDRSINPQGSLASTVDDIDAARRAASRPAYQAAVDEAPDLMLSDDVLTLMKDSRVVRNALTAARGDPNLKNLPSNSMRVLDDVYKTVGDKANAAKKAGEGHAAFKLEGQRDRLKAGIIEENPAYGDALDAYSGPSKLIDAAEMGREWFTKNTDPAVVKKAYAAMSPDEKQAALVGIRDWARTTIGRSDRGIAAERVYGGGDNRARLQAVLGDEGYNQLIKALDVERNLIKTSRDINVGSRTAPMALEASDNALQMDVISDLGRGNVRGLIGRALEGTVNRLAEGRTEAVNARIAEMLTSTDPRQVGLVAALLERARLEELAKSSGRRNALAIGGVSAPAVNALGERR